MLIFDVGANRGTFTDEYLSLLDSCEDVKVIQVEANPKLLEYLEKKYENNPNIVQDCSLLSNVENEYLDFFICSADTISTASIDWLTDSRFSRYYEHPYHVNTKLDWNTMKMKTKTLDNLIDLYGVPDLLKIDVEGYEYEVLSGLSQKVNEVCFEWVEEQFDKANNCVNHLKKLGFESFGVILEDKPIRPEVYADWEDITFNLDPERKLIWGMIWAK